MLVGRLGGAPAYGGASSRYRFWQWRFTGGGRIATMCPVINKVRDCTMFTGTSTTGPSVSKCTSGLPSEPYCAVTVLDHYTSSFHWAQTNFSAIWLRPQWYLVDNSVVTDVQNGGLSFITRSNYTEYNKSSRYQGSTTSLEYLARPAGAISNPIATTST